MLIAVLVAGAMGQEELALRTLIHRVELVHVVEWKAEREDLEEAERLAHNEEPLP
jgi:hypothetical protein